MQTPIITNMTIKFNPFIRIDRGLTRSMKLAGLMVKSNIVAKIVQEISDDIDREIMKDLFGCTNAILGL